MQLTHAHNLALARTYVAALADHAVSEDASSAYEHVLIGLDRLHDDRSPDTYPDALIGDRHLWFELATVSIKNLPHHGADPLSVELICWALHDAYSIDADGVCG